MALPNPRTLRLGILGLLLGGYLALLGYGAVTETAAASALADLYVAVILFAAVGARVWLEEVGEGAHQLETLAFLVAGIAIGYAGLAGLSVVPPVGPADVIGNLAVLVAVGLLVYRRNSEFGVAD
jgi:hypothetical protein